jgi:NAD(P)H dehydrogenase (quinone)
MAPPARTRKSALVVHAHPEPASFSAAQARVAEATLRDRGYDVTTLDLYAAHWAPVLDRGEFAPAPGPFKPQAAQARAFADDSLAGDVRADLDRLLAADLLVLSFPLWWFSMPAVLKGWVDRVFVMGAVFGGPLGLFGDAALAGRRALLLLSTGGPAEAFAPEGTFGDLDAFLFHVHRGMLEFVGYDVLEPVVTFGPAHLDDEERAGALTAVREAFDALDGRAGYRRPGAVRA